MAIPEEIQQDEMEQQPAGEEDGPAREEPESDPEPRGKNEEGPITGEQPPEPGGGEGEESSGEPQEDEEDSRDEGHADGDTTAAEAPEGEEPGPTEEQGAEPQRAENTPEMKLAVQITAGRTIVGVQRAGTDPHVETIQEEDLVAVLWEIPGIVERAQESWEESPMRPRYQKPKATSGRKNQGRDKTKQAEQPPGAAGEPQQGELQQPEEEKPGMGRLF